MAVKPLSSVTYWNHFVRYSGEHGIDVEPTIARLGPTTKQDFIPFEDFKALVAEIYQKSAKPWLGLDFAQKLQISSHGSLGFAVSHGVDLEECLTLISRYYQTRLQAMEIQGRIEGNVFTLSLTQTCDWRPVEIVLYEALILSVLNIIEYIIGNEIKQCTVKLPYDEPEWGDKYREFLPCPVVFSQGCAELIIPLSLLSVRCVSANPRSVDLAKNQCDLELARLNQYETLSQKIAYLIERNQSDDLSLEAVAKHLNMSKSTLSRKLKLEDTSYKAILENLKKQQASQLLLNSDLTVEVIALKLGYEDNSNFGRSFKRWFGCTPGVYRQNHLSPQENLDSK